MSIRYRLSEIGEQRMAQLHWCRKNIPSYAHSVSATGVYVDFLDDEDAVAFSIKFGISKHSTLIERMIAREEKLERMEAWNLRHTTQGLGPI